MHIYSTHARLSTGASDRSLRTQSYSVSCVQVLFAGVVGQHGLISPSTASGGSPQMSPARLPLGIDLPSPPNASPGVLVRPVPQQPSTLRVRFFSRGGRPTVRITGNVIFVRMRLLIHKCVVTCTSSLDQVRLFVLASRAQGQIIDV